MKDYPYFKAYVAEILFDVMGKTQHEKGDYLDSLLLAWKTMNPAIMPQWMQEYADDTIRKSAKLSENSKVRWTNAMQLHNKSNPNAMQIPYIEERRGEERIGDKEIEKPKSDSRNLFIPPTIAECEEFFVSNKKDKEMASEFFYHYDARGWIVGKATMKKWKSAAFGWIARANKFVNKFESHKQETKTLDQIMNEAAFKMAETGRKN